MKMTAQEKSEGLMGANPYNKNKEWDGENKTGEEFVSADDSMAYVKKKKYAIVDKMETKQEPKEDETATPQGEGTDEQPKEQQAEPWKRVDYKKRYDDLKRHYDRKVNEFKDKEKELKQQAREAAPKYTPPKTQEELAQFREDNPDIFDVVETISHLQASQQLTDLQEELKEVRESLQMEEARRAYAELKTLVPDFEEIRQSEQFHEWAENQPTEIQDWIYKNRTNVQLAAQAINLYKASMNTGQQPPRVNTQSDSRGSADESVSVRSSKEEPTSQEKIWTRQEIQSLSVDQYDKLSKEIDKAFTEGRVQI